MVEVPVGPDDGFDGAVGDVNAVFLQDFRYVLVDLEFPAWRGAGNGESGRGT